MLRHLTRQSGNQHSNRSRNPSNGPSANQNPLASSQTPRLTRAEVLPSIRSPKTIISHVETTEHHQTTNGLKTDKPNFFQDKTACVTGAGRGIGRSVALRLAQVGCRRVIAVGRTETYLFDLAKEHESIIPVVVDVTNWMATKKAIEPYLPIHLLVNNAGVLILNSFHDIQREDFDTSFQTNVRPVIGLTQEVTKDLIARNIPGSIVNVSSIASAIAADKFMIYAGTKACMDAFTRNMAAELGPHNIRVNSVQPTVVLTDMGKAAGWENEQQSAPLLAKTPLGRFAEVNEVVEPILFLLSDKSSMITGACLPVDGGYLAT